MRSVRLFLLACASVSVAALQGCGGESSSTTASAPLTARDFASAPPLEPAPAPAKPAPHTRPDAAVAQGHVQGPVEASGGIDDVRVLVGAPEPPPPASHPGAVANVTPTPAPGPAAAAPQGAIIDSLVGQINGRPVFAEEFFAPMDARLRAEARTSHSRDEWLNRPGGARTQIRSALVDKMRDELLLAEFEAALSPEQRQGVLAFVEDLRGNLTSLAEGSKELANRRLQETEGVTLEEKVKLERDRELIRAQINKVLGDRAYVAWREVVQAYDRDAAKYHPGATALLRVIQAPLRDEARLARIQAAIDAKEDWAAIAARDGAYRPREGGLYEVPISPEGYEKTTFYSGEELNAAVRSLAVGQTLQMDFAGSRLWIRLEEINQPPGRSLYSAQLEIMNGILGTRMAEEEVKYFDQLISRTSATELSLMINRLERLAIERYAPYLVNVPRGSSSPLAPPPRTPAQGPPPSGGQPQPQPQQAPPGG